MKIKDPHERRKVFAMNASLLAVFAVFIGGGYLYGGVDFAKGTLIGCLVVAINFFISQRLVGKLILEKSIKPNLLIAYFVKLALSVLILFVAVVKYQVHLVGLMLGLSSVIFSSVFTTLVRKNTEQEEA